MADHSIVAPHTSTRDELLNTVQANWASARSYIPSTSQAQAYFAPAEDNSLYSTWTDSALREFLLKHGVIAPATHREELIKLAQEYSSSASKTVSSATAAATDSISSGVDKASSVASSAFSTATDTVSSAFYAATDAPSLAYDYLSAKLSGELSFFLPLGSLGSHIYSY